MVFNSLVFLVFFVVVYGLYRVLPHRGQNVLILASSYFFYGWWDWRFLSLIFISTVIDYVAARVIDDAGDNRRRRRIAVGASIVSNLGILGFFKYFNFFAENLAALLQTFGVEVSLRHLNIVLPVGISFYTFQTMSYTLDVYRGQMRAARSFLDFAAFVSFFPQLVAGPIERAARLLPQIQQPRTIARNGLESGAWLVAWGLFKKCVVADNLAVLVDGAFRADAPTGAVALLAVYAFAFQIYCDFSGYSDIARGLSRWMGIELMLNFDNPYFAVNPKDFWARWHVSLSSWLRDYLYISLGGNRRGRRRTYVNLALTMLLGGLWHGAAWTFIAWGAFHGAMLVVYHAWAEKFSPKGTVDSGRWLWPRRIFFFQLTCLGWLLFRAESLGQVRDMLARIFTSFAWDAQATDMLAALVLFCLPLWLVQLLQTKTGDLLAPTRLSIVPRAALYATLILMALAFGNTGGGAFIYFQF